MKMKKNLSDIPRIYHPWWDWECYKSGFYSTTPPLGSESDKCKQRYAEFLKNSVLFKDAINRVFKEWPNSCEHFLTNPNINRIAWLGQASMCITSSIPACFRSGFTLLSAEDQYIANEVSRKAIESWILKRT